MSEIYHTDPSGGEGEADDIHTAIIFKHPKPRQESQVKHYRSFESSPWMLYSA